MNHDHSASATAASEAALGRSIGKTLTAESHDEPSLKTQLFRGCETCRAPSCFITSLHPLAERYPSLVDDTRPGRYVGETCLHCAGSLPLPGPVVEVPAVVTDTSPRMRLARLLISIGNALRRLQKRIDP